MLSMDILIIVGKMMDIDIVVVVVVLENKGNIVVGFIIRIVKDISIVDLLYMDSGLAKD